VVNPNEKEPKQDEFSISLEQELVSNFAVRATGVYSRAMNTYRIQNNRRPYEAYSIPITNRDPGPDGEVGNGDDGGLVTYHEFSPDLAGLDNEVMMPINDPRADPTYKSFELAAVRRLANRWQFMVSYSATKVNRPMNYDLAISPEINGDEQRSSIYAANYNPNAEFNTAVRTWDWDAKFTGSYLFPADVLVSANFHHNSGEPFARTVRFEGGETIPDIVMNVEPIGTRRLPNINLLTLRLEKNFRLTAAQRVAVRLNVYNALNANTAIEVRERSGDEFLLTQDIMLPRLFELSFSYTF